jgi:hypothetical protein
MPVEPGAAERRWPERPGFTGICSKKTIMREVQLIVVDRGWCHDDLIVARVDV